jgi:hypothetical protein
VRATAWRPSPSLGLGLGLGLAILVEVGFLIAIPRYVTVDGATHLGGAALIRDFLQGAGGLHLRYVELTSFPAPNLLPEVLLGLVMLVVDPPTAEKLLQLAYVVALPLGLLYAARSVNRGGAWVALLAIPLTFTFAFQFGFYDFSLGVAAFLVAAGYAWREREAPGWHAGIVFGLLSLLVYLTHLVPFVELVVFLAVLGASRVLSSWRARGSQAAFGTARELLPLVAGAAPSVALAAIFFASTRSGVPAEYLNPLLQAIGILGLAIGLATVDPLEIVAAVVLALTLAALLFAAVWRRVRSGGFGIRDEDALFGYALVALLIALVAPGSVASGGSYIPERLALFPVYGLALWLAAPDVPRRSRAIAGAMFVAVAVAITVIRLPTTLRLSAAAVELESVVPCIVHDSTMVQANLADFPAGALGRTDPFGAEAGRIAAATHGHDLGDWEWSFPFSVVHNRADNDPFRWLVNSPDGFEVPPGIDVRAFATRPDGRAEYVLVVGRPSATPATLASPGWTSLRDELAVDYRLVALSTNGLVEAWEWRDPTLAEAGAAQRSSGGGPVCH